MSRRLKSLPTLEGDQRLASDPSAHAALSASAGTGKTQVLTARVLRLLLGGVPPQSILCLTFTKAGAAEMANRLGERLAAWVRMDDAALGADLAALDEDVGPDARMRARRLFARVLEAPGGLRIQTIHSFAQTLLASFPAEAGISPGFQAIEGRAERELARRTLASLLSDAEERENHALLRDVEALSLRLGEGGAVDYLMAAARSRDAIVALGPPAEFEGRLRLAMGLGEEDVESRLAAECGDDQFDCGLLGRLMDANRAWGTKTGIDIAERIAAWLAAPNEERATTLSAMAAGVVKKDFEPNKLRDTDKRHAIEPNYVDLAARLAATVRRHHEARAAALLAGIQAAGLRAGAAFAEAYASAKRAAGVVDFDDLIRWTRALFAQPGMGEWIRFKLDQRTDHVLVDEAQDTNADQWAIVDAMVSEYFSGSAESEHRRRTLFMVGDFKQAIYSFQGTDPKEFETYRQSVAERAQAMDLAALDSEVFAREFRDLSISASFRSSQAVLDVVDALIDEVGHEAMGLVQPPEPHRAFHDLRPGVVEVWPPFMPDARDEEDQAEEGWIDEPLRRYADRIAEQVRRWIDEAPVLATTGRPLTPGDILILVRSRTELASLIVARLYGQRVPVAGIDRLHLSKPLAVKDLLSAITFAVQPNDDLNLASLLVSPLVGLDQTQLFDLAFDRRGSLWAELRRRRGESAPFAAAHGMLEGLLAMADFVTPARFLETILSGPIGGRAKILGRLGEAARDPIEELVSSALEFERQETPSLDRFLAWFASGDVEVKRDPSAPSNAVRVMTVHGAKGLEAPIVILADSTHDPARVGGHSPVVELGLGRDADPVPLVRPRSDEMVEPFGSMIADQKRRDLEEHWRLLYVAMTRAAERLLIAGAMPRYGVVENSWHQVAAVAMDRLGASSEASALWGEVRRWVRAGPVRSASTRAARPLPAPARPGWADRPAPQEETPPRPLAPSAVTDKESTPPPSPDQRRAARRGTLLHGLFDRLPAVPPAEREARAVGWLERSGVSDREEREEIVQAALRVLEDASFADLFAPTALGEAPIAATLSDGRVIAGTVDRLCIGDTVVKVIDFKTGRFVPSSPSDVPASHHAQMRAYSDALSVIFPGRKVEAALLYTHGPRMIALDG